MFNSPDEVTKFIKDEDVKFVDVRFCDLPGVMQHFNVPASTVGTDFFTDGQMFESLDGGDTWTIVADVPPVSKADFYKGLVRDRVKLANVDDIVASPTATKRWQEAGKGL